MTISQLLGNVKSVFTNLIGILFVVATVIFLWGIIQYVIAGGDEDKLSNAKNVIIWGLIGLFVMTVMWSLVEAVKKLFFT